jgi:AcrR family transcriptional regulator
MAGNKTSTRISYRGIQTREQILQAARQLFAAKGYHNTSVYDLFDEAGITKGALFHHWKTKEDLAMAILADVEMNFEEQFFKLANGEGRAREKIDRLLRLIAELSLSGTWTYGRIFAIWSAELPAEKNKVGAAVHALRARWCMLWKELIRKAQLEHDLRTDILAENLSFLVISAICGVQLMSGKEEANNSTKAVYETLRKTLLT